MSDSVSYPLRLPKSLKEKVVKRLRKAMRFIRRTETRDIVKKRAPANDSVSVYISVLYRSPHTKG